MIGRVGRVHGRIGEHCGQAVEEVGLPHRLDQEGRDAHLLHQVRVAPFSDRRHEHEAGRRQRLVGLDGPRERHSIHARHLHVEDGRGEGVTDVLGARQGEQRRRAVTGLLRAHAPGRELGGQDLAVRGVVVHHEDVDAADLGGRGDGALPIALLGESRREPELRPAPLLADQADPATHQLGQLLRDREPQPGAAVPARGRGVGLRELLEQRLLVLGRDADARVLHRDVQQDVVLRLRRETDPHGDLAVVGELEGIAGEIGEHLAEPTRVADEEGRHVGRRGADELQPLRMGAQGERSREVVQQSEQVEVERFELQPARLDLGEVEDVAEERQERVAARAHGLREASLVLVEVGVEQEAGHADHPVEGRPDLVAHVGKEVALGHVGRLGPQGHLGRLGDRGLEPPVRLLELGLGALALGEIGIRPRDPDGPSGLVAEQERARVDGHPMAVPVAQAELDLVARLAALAGSRDHLVHAFDVVGVREPAPEPGLGRQVALRVPDHLPPARGVVGGVRHVIPDPPAVVGAPQHELEAILRLRQGRLGLLAPGDVARDAERADHVPVDIPVGELRGRHPGPAAVGPGLALLSVDQGQAGPHDLPFVLEGRPSMIGQEEVGIGLADRLRGVAQAERRGQGRADQREAALGVLEVDVVRGAVEQCVEPCLFSRAVPAHAACER